MSISASPLVLLRRQLLAWPWVAGMSGCAPPPRSKVTFIGDGPADMFRPWRLFQEAAQAHQSGLLMQASLTYLDCPKHDHAAKRSAIQAAARAGTDVLVAPSGNSATMAVAVAGSTPVVFASFLDPVRAGFARSDRVPGGMATGISLADLLDGKRLQTLRDAFEGIQRIGILTDRSWAQHYQGEARILADARALGLETSLHIGETAADIDRLMTSPLAARQHAWYVMPTDLAYVGEAQIRSHLTRLGAPGMFSTLGEVERGGAMAYVADAGFVYPKLAELVARVVRGEAPGQIPIERPRRFLLVARADVRWQGRPISARLLRRANRIV